jgi:hypothetical protein
MAARSGRLKNKEPPADQAANDPASLVVRKPQKPLASE